MEWYYNQIFIASHTNLFTGMIIAGLVMVVLTIIFVAKEIKENAHK